MEKWSSQHRLIFRCTDIPLQGETDLHIFGDLQIKENDGNYIDVTRGRVTTHRVLFLHGTQWGCCKLIDFNAARFVGGWMKSKKVVLETSTGQEVSVRVDKIEDAMRVITEALLKKAWQHGSYEPKALVGGMDRVLHMRKKKLADDKEGSSGALTDLDALKKNAQAMVALTKRVAAKDSGEENDMQKLLNDYGLKDAKDLRSTSLEEELTKVTLHLVNNSNMMLIEDLYCVFNRLRGTNLVSPHDFMSSLTEVGKGRDLRVHPIHGALCVQRRGVDEEKMSKDLAERCKIHPLSAAQVSKERQISLRLAQVQLLDAEERGHVCRDDSIEGLVFYHNFFLS
eukprot:GEMP01033987.1.p1 GENE.GEMP01033987.1~~GEMP01033987.1.p1  ORF type:complete len:340 (+),score=73.40 GEMP01033987.1:158-1177(+)